MKAPLRIAILECDTPPDDLVAQFGRYGKVFRTLLEAAADNLGVSGFSKDSLELSAYDVVSEQRYPDLEQIDAVLISGSSESWDGYTARRVLTPCKSTIPLTTTRGF